MPSPMKVSQDGLFEIIESEAIVLSPYKDSVGVWTIGIGHTAAAGAPDPANLIGKTITLREALDLFRTDLNKYEARVRKAFKVPMDQYEFDAAVSFDFNTGAIHKATWVKEFNEGKRELAVRHIMNYTKPPEIKPRREREQELFDDGVYHNLEGEAVIYTATPSGKIVWSKPQRVQLKHELAALEVKPEAKVVKEELKAAGSVTINAADVQKNIAVGGAIITAGTGFVGSFTKLIEGIPPYLWVVLVIGALGAIWYFSNRIQKVRVNDAIEGRNIGLIVPSLAKEEDVSS